MCYLNTLHIKKSLFFAIHLLLRMICKNRHILLYIVHTTNTLKKGSLNSMKKKFMSLIFALCLATTSQVYAYTDTYTVQKGDTLWKIASKYKVGISEIIESNPQFSNPNMIHPGEKVYITLPDPSIKSLEEQILLLVNKERSNQGLAPVALNWQISRIARIKSEDMRDNDYFSHQSPTYGSPFDMLRKFNIAYRTAGENIAKGQRTPEDVMRAWMNSEDHRKNILNPDFTELGVGYCEGRDTTFWTQIFIYS